MTIKDSDTIFRKRIGEHRLRMIDFRIMLPSMVTMIALCSGSTAIRFALDGRLEAAMVAIVVAGVLDGIDGSLARFLKAPTKFGAELDSLSDIVSFGVAPAMLLYLWTLKDWKGGGWIVALAFVVCCALRLARFNSRLEDDEEPRRKAGFLTGVPSPVAAGLAMLPLMAVVQHQQSWAEHPQFVAAYTALICLAMVSKTPTYSFRNLLISREYFVPLLLAVGLFAAALTAYGWTPFLFFGVFYWLSIPLGWFRYRHLSQTRA